MNSNWTLVTGYFIIKNWSRDIDFYLSKCHNVLSLDCNMIIFCEMEVYNKIYQIRKSFDKLHKSFFVPMQFDDLPYMRYLTQVNNNRSKTKPIDTRNISEYFLLTCSKYWFIKKAIEFNPFTSSHFAWMDFGYSHAAELSQKLLDDAFSVNRNKLSFCYIDYTSKEVVEDIVRYYDHGLIGRCGTSGNFFTGSKDIFDKAIPIIESHIKYTINSGYGHNDEQIIPPIYLKYPDMFEFYFGDYRHTLSNYIHIHGSHKTVIYCFINNCIIYNEHDLKNKAIKDLKYSSDNNLIQLSDEDINYLKTYVSDFN